MITTTDKKDAQESTLANMDRLVKLYEKVQNKILDSDKQNLIDREVLALMCQAFAFGFLTGRYRSKN
jgi:hypothetical protein